VRRVFIYACLCFFLNGYTGYEELYGLCHSLDDKEPLPLRLPSKWSNPVIVTGGQSSYDAEDGYSINEGETFGSFCYAASRSDLSLQAALSEDKELRVYNYYSDLRIQFHRTIRVPENRVTYDLPPDMGCIPLHNVAEFASRIPTEVNARGGIFFPLYQREAVWLSFKAMNLFSIKVFAGGINAISRLPWNQKEETKIQDYVVVPPQMWLDGVVSEQGLIKQFVAMPVRSGYGIEQQITGEETLGGLQLMITPAFPQNFGCWPRQALSAPYEGREFERENKYNLMPPIGSSKRYNMLESPKGVGLRRGSIIFNCYPDIVFYDEKEWGEDGYARQNRPSFLFELFTKEGHLDQTASETAIAVHQFRLRCTIRSWFLEKGTDFTIDVSPWTTVYELHNVIKDKGKSDELPLIRFELYHERFHWRNLISPKQLTLPLWRAGLRDDSRIIILDNSLVNSMDGDRIGHQLPRHVRIGGTGWNMGLAAGGNIRQRIHKDENPPNIWIRPAETLLNAQILNSVAFESATGMVTPPTPINPETYIKAGLPFFKEYPAVETAECNALEISAKLNTVQELDGVKGIRFADSVGTGSLVGCIQCEKNLCDCM
jgi:hypothetical protein